MAKQIYIDSNGNEVMLSGTINSADILPISAGSSTDTKDYIDNKYKDFIYEGTNVAITTSYSSGAMYYANISLPDLDSAKMISLTLTDYGALSDVLMFQITSRNSFRVWSKTSQTLTTLKVRIFYQKS